MYLNKLVLLKNLQKASTHLGALKSAKNLKWSRFTAQRTQSYILGYRASQAIIDLDKTVISLRRACNLIRLISKANGHFLFVNTNPKYNKILIHTANASNQSYINHKWVGGFLTNWNHMQNVQQQFFAASMFSVANYRFAPLASCGTELNEDFRASIRASASSTPRYKKMQKCFEGTTKSNGAPYFVPDCVIILNPNQNYTAIYEAHLNQIPIISLVDSNISNELYKLITYPIPANPNSLQFIYFFCNCLLKTILRPH